jgi:hypothetical protein
MCTQKQLYTLTAAIRLWLVSISLVWSRVVDSYHAALFGSRKRITDPPTERIAPEVLINFRKTYFEKAENYVVSPVRLDDEGAPVNFPRSRAT